MHFPTHFPPSRSLATALVVLLLAACGKPSPDKLMAEGRSALQRSDAPAAVIHLKGFVQAAPASAEGRVLLGQALLAANDPAGAIVELERAKELGAKVADFALPLAQALTATGRNKDVVDRLAGVSLADPKLEAELRVEVAAAMLRLGDAERAQSALKAALKADASNPVARLMDARFTAIRGDVDAAMRQTEALLADTPKSPGALQLKGELLLVGKNDLAASVPVFQAALAADPTFVPAHLSLMDIRIRQNDMKAYEAQVNALKTALPKHPETMFAEIQLALFKNDLVAAKEKSERLLLLAPDDARALFFAGVTQLRAKSVVVAEGHLAKAVQLAPQAASSRRVLAQLHLDNGDASRSLDVLGPLLSSTPPDPLALQIAGQAELQRGRLPQAESFFKQAVAINPANAQARTALALTSIAKGDVEQGFVQLERLASTEKDLQTDLTLIATLLSRGELDKALKAVAALEAKAPSVPVSHALRGRILLQQGKTAEARQNFEKALALDAKYYPGVIGLVELDVNERKWDSAVARLQAHLRDVPRNYAALLRLTQVRVAANVAPDVIKRSLEEAVQANPADAAPRLLLVNFLISRRDLAAARASADQAVAAVPGSAELEDALGRVLMEMGDARQAVSSFGKVVSLRPTSALAYLRLGTAQLRAGDQSAGRASLQRARQIDPRSAEVLQAVMTLTLTERKFGEALTLARETQKLAPTDPLGYLLEADVHLNQKKLPEAIKAMSEAFSRQRSSALALRLHALQVLANRTAEANRFADEWLRTNPADADFIAQLGAMALQQGDLVKAEARFRQAVGVRADHVVALNNLAWVLVQQSKPDALQYARKANEINPGQPALMDTLASALRASGAMPEAVQWQRKAVTTSNGEPRYRMRLAEILLATGDVAGAKEELKVLDKLGENFPQRDKVLEMLKSAG